MRNISFSMTTAQFISGQKDVTRRFGWWNLKPGDKLMAVEKAMGLKKGEKVKHLGIIKIINSAPEALSRMIEDPEYGMEELRREGFPFGHRCPKAFAEDLARQHNVSVHARVNRIEFKRI